MSIKQIPILLCILFFWAIGATCYADPAINARLSQIEKRLDTVEANLANLSKNLSELVALYGTDLPLPHRPKSELQVDIQRLERRRASYLLNVTPQHPTITSIDRKIRMLQWQISVQQ